MQGQEYAVFTELSPDNKAMTPGFNTRVFTDVNSQRGDSTGATSKPARSRSRRARIT